MWDGFDHRKFPRLKLQCEITIESSVFKEPIVTQTENIGTGGVCVVQRYPLERFEKCRIKMKLPDNGQLIECDGRVCWVIGRKGYERAESPAYDTGIEFLRLKESDKGRIGLFIQNCVRKGFERIC